MRAFGSALRDDGNLYRLHHELRRMQENAFVLPDGRRVFKTMDGSRVLDEHGAEVPARIIDPHMIDGRYTKWESLKAVTDGVAQLESERRDLIEFQAKVDEARIRADQGGLTKKQLDDLEARLKASAPPAVRQGLGVGDPGDGGTRAKSEASPAMSLDDLLRSGAPHPAPI